MELIRGQNISLDSKQPLRIDIGWRSLTADLGLEAYGLAVDENKQLTTPGHFLWGDNAVITDLITRHTQGKLFELTLPVLATPYERFYIVLALPVNSRYNFSQVSNIQVRVNSGQAARINIPSCSPETKSLTLLEVYRHKGQWKLRFIGFESPSDLSAVAEQYQFSLPQPLQADDGISLAEGAELAPGENLSLSEHFSHCKHLLWQARSVPGLDDIELNVVAVNVESQVKNIKDFLYTANPVLRGDGVILTKAKGEIHLEQIPNDIAKLELLVTRSPETKRFSSVDYVETRLVSAVTGQPVCKFIFETAAKNYNSAILFEIYRHQGEWRVRGMGQGYAEGIKKIGEKYGFAAPKQRSTASVAQQPTSNRSTTPSTQTPIPTTVVDNTPTPLPKHPYLGYGVASMGGLISLLGYTSIPMLLLGSGMIAGGAAFSWKTHTKTKAAQQEHNERIILNMIKERNYRVTAFELASSHTMTIEEVTVILQYLCAKGAGQVEIDEHGKEIYVFDKMRSDHNASNETHNW
ncbi:TerD family protein [Endozoicomonas sp. SM1973]|uniref:TerD family protein n=1 Tax=Spartinivicinus marinus TaxID=2994442 RepID=A0A853IBX0_9GAMM|nr:TerD family protein [Spartinivicinus marinus]MCX4029727.1 TerD family protein [Spartinivicinus marinus]NYZ68058.1 TerD family protein [Spartinivicinus marinus]